MRCDRPACRQAKLILLEGQTKFLQASIAYRRRTGVPRFSLPHAGPAPSGFASCAPVRSSDHQPRGCRSAKHRLPFSHWARGACVCVCARVRAHGVRPCVCKGRMLTQGCVMSSASAAAVPLPSEPTQAVLPPPKPSRDPLVFPVARASPAPPRSALPPHTRGAYTRRACTLVRALLALCSERQRKRTRAIPAQAALGGQGSAIPSYSRTVQPHADRSTAAPYIHTQRTCSPPLRLLSRELLPCPSRRERIACTI